MTPEDFADYLEAECDRSGLHRETFCANKGDVLFWHGSLVHGGSPPNSDRTRKSFVTHYSTRQAHPLDRRFPDRQPEAYQLGEGFTYVDARRPSEEDAFPHPREARAGTG